MKAALTTAALVLGVASCAPTPASTPVAGIDQWRGVDAARGADRSVALVDRSGKGAVLCTWSLLVTAQEVGRRCFSDQDESFQEELEASINKIEVFIQQNSSSRPSASDIAARKAAMVRRTGGAVCSADLVRLYRSFRDRGADALRASTDDMLSTPREPVMNPCV